MSQTNLLAVTNVYQSAIMLTIILPDCNCCHLVNAAQLKQRITAQLERTAKNPYISQVLFKIDGRNFALRSIISIKNTMP